MRDERTCLRGKPGMKSDEADDGGANRGEHGRAGENPRQRGVTSLAPDLVPHPADLPIDVGTDGADNGGEHQLRPLAIIPMMTPTRTAPASAPHGLRRVMFSSSAAKVLAWSLADDASSEPASATPLAALPTCEVTVWLTLRMVFATSSPFWAARRAKASFTLATSRRSLFTSWFKRSGSTLSESLPPKVDSADVPGCVGPRADTVRDVCPDDGLEFMWVVSLVFYALWIGAGTAGRMGIPAITGLSRIGPAPPCSIQQGRASVFLCPLP